MSLEIIQLPLAIGDLVGIIAFLVVAILSALSKRGQKEEQPVQPVRRVPPRQSSTPPSSAAPQDLGEELRRFLDEQRQVTAPPALPHRTPGSHVPPPMPRITSRRRVVVSAAKKSTAPVKILEEPAHPQSPLHGVLETSLQEEVRQSMQAANKDTSVAFDDSAFKPSRTEETTVRPSARFDPAMLRSPTTLRHAILLTEILGRPRAINPF